MAKENKEVTERMREDIVAEQEEIAAAIKDILSYTKVRLEVLQYRIKISHKPVNISEIIGAVEEWVKDGLYPLAKELNNHLEDL